MGIMLMHIWCFLGKVNQNNRIITFTRKGKDVVRGTEEAFLALHEDREASASTWVSVAPQSGACPAFLPCADLGSRSTYIVPGL